MEHRRAGPTNKRILAEHLIERLRDRFAPARCCITARANGIRANRCRAGPWPATGARTACRCGATTNLWRARSRQAPIRSDGGAAFLRDPGAPAGRRSGLRQCRPSRIRSTTCSSERQLPVNVDPLDNHLEDRAGARAAAPGVRTRPRIRRRLRAAAAARHRQERTRMADRPVDAARPAPVPGARRFAGRFAPAAAELPWVAPDDAPRDHPAVDPMVERGPLPCRRAMSPADPVLQREHDRQRSATGSRRSANPRPGSCAPRCASNRATAGCTSSCRPSQTLEDYIDLLAAIEDTAAHLGMPVVIEGYTPPYDPRINTIKVTPDPGVIEVNIQPAHNWARTGGATPPRSTRRPASPGWARRNSCSTAGIPAPAAATTSCSAAATPADSPFLRRPDLLRSMLGLLAESSVASPICSPACSSAPPARRRASTKRAATASTNWRSRSARSRIRAKARVPPWLVDRIFRHILVDVTGNTHRAEFCIDKLYSPDTATGRLGLLELRGFEMPPHARMSLTQQLLVRALVAWFWKQPYTAQPGRLGHAAARPVSCCRISSRGDFREVLDDLNARRLSRSRPNGSRRISNSAIRSSGA